MSILYIKYLRVGQTAYWSIKTLVGSIIETDFQSMYSNTDQ